MEIHAENSGIPGANAGFSHRGAHIKSAKHEVPYCRGPGRLRVLEAPGFRCYLVQSEPFFEAL